MEHRTEIRAEGVCSSLPVELGRAVGMIDQPPQVPQPTLRSEEGIVLLRTWAFIDELIAQYGTEYTATFTRVIEAASHDDQPRYTSELDAAIGILIRLGWTREQSATIATSHAKSVYAAISDDLQAHVDNGGALPCRRRPTGNESA
ncbi:hypothetical protein [Nocardia higoensis]|uniref:hypothetical protein n=1 Tax=Nocardia higoensis TaxID=228599 RepID=UPI0002FC6672|nr:hypothetical protein [Nocardia higoensis]